MRQPDYRVRTERSSCSMVIRYIPSEREYMQMRLTNIGVPSLFVQWFSPRPSTQSSYTSRRCQSHRANRSRGCDRERQDTMKVAILLVVLATCVAVTSSEKAQCRRRMSAEAYRSLVLPDSLAIYWTITEYKGYCRQGPIREGYPFPPMKCLYKDEGKSWWFKAKQSFPIMRTVNNRCVICYGCNWRGTTCITTPRPCTKQWQAGDPDDDVFKPFEVLHR
ncbi:hypothetical protein LSAT2_005992 [Lamellibrachia satsuma]|nr:hypothetical protein LSAT2_005992 [Lamellibrachia satsuma]